MPNLKDQIRESLGIGPTRYLLTEIKTLTDKRDALSDKDKKRLDFFNKNPYATISNVIPDRFINVDTEFPMKNYTQSDIDFLNMTLAPVMKVASSSGRMIIIPLPAYSFLLSGQPYVHSYPTYSSDTQAMLTTRHEAGVAEYVKKIQIALDGLGLSISIPAPVMVTSGYNHTLNAPPALISACIAQIAKLVAPHATKIASVIGTYTQQRVNDIRAYVKNLFSVYHPLISQNALATAMGTGSLKDTPDFAILETLYNSGMLQNLDASMRIGLMRRDAYDEPMLDFPDKIGANFTDSLFKQDNLGLFFHKTKIVTITDAGKSKLLTMINSLATVRNISAGFVALSSKNIVEFKKYYPTFNLYISVLDHFNKFQTTGAVFQPWLPELTKSIVGGNIQKSLSILKANALRPEGIYAGTPFQSLQAFIFLCTMGYLKSGDMITSDLTKFFGTDENSSHIYERIKAMGTNFNTDGSFTFPKFVVDVIGADWSPTSLPTGKMICKVIQDCLVEADAVYKIIVPSSNN